MLHTTSLIEDCDSLYIETKGDRHIMNNKSRFAGVVALGIFTCLLLGYLNIVDTLQHLFVCSMSVFLKY